MTTTNYEILKAWIAGKEIEESSSSTLLFPPPISKTIGFRLIDISSDDISATVELATDPKIHANPLGTIHGGVLCDIADAAIGCAHWSTLKPKETFTSIDLKINFFRPLWKSKIRAIAKVLHYGNTLSYYNCNIIQEKDNKLIATVTSTVMTLRGEAATGR